MRCQYFIDQLIYFAIEKGLKNSSLDHVKKIKNVSLDVIVDIADSLGYRLALEPPEKNLWFTCGGNWKDLLRMLVFHFWNLEDAELISKGKLNLVEEINRTSDRRVRLLKEFGMDAKCFTTWLQKGKIPSFESFLVLAAAEGFKVMWRSK